RSGQARLNLNSSGRDQLQDRLGDALTAQEIDAILSFRSNARATTRIAPMPLIGPARAPGGMPGGPPGASGGSPIPPVSGSNSNRRFESTGQLLEVPGLTRDKVEKIADRVTVTDDERIPGRINLNTASEEVLTSLPGVTDSIARDILEYRLGNDGPFEEVGEILAVESVTSDVYRKIADVITTRSSIFKLNSGGYLRQSKTRKIVECVISFLKNESEGASAPDTTPSEPGTPLPATILYWRQRP
ncbi:MAG: helix-hairpin-helix domain-containing protein, partial [Armatimonadetes bacterium]|nr:helix-hairpin-helix domain-containing protein [Armatimonadota bacterium]